MAERLGVLQQKHKEHCRHDDYSPLLCTTKRQTMALPLLHLQLHPRQWPCHSCSKYYLQLLALLLAMLLLLLA